MGIGIGDDSAAVKADIFINLQLFSQILYKSTQCSMTVSQSFSFHIHFDYMVLFSHATLYDATVFSFYRCRSMLQVLSAPIVNIRCAPCVTECGEGKGNSSLFSLIFVHFGKGTILRIVNWGYISFN